MDLITRFVLLSLFKIVSPSNMSSTTVIPIKNEDLKPGNMSTTTVRPVKNEGLQTPNMSSTTVRPVRNEGLQTPNIYWATVRPFQYENQKTSNTYEVTENIKDIPDDRTFAPIIPNFGVLTPLNFGNNAIAFNNNNNKEQSSESSEENEVDVKNSTSNGNFKKHSFSILHIKSEYDDKPVTEHQNMFSKVFGGIKSYVYNLKKGVVDGLHSFFHHHNDKPDKEIEHHFHKYDKFHRSFDGVEDFGDESDYYDDEESREHFSHY